MIRTLALSAGVLSATGVAALVEQDVDPKPAALKCNDADAATWTKTGKAAFKTEMTACGHKCWGASACMSSCIKSKEAYSDNCSSCFGDLGQCTRDNCSFQCMGGESKACAKCTEKYCVGDFKSCSGFELPSSDGSDLVDMLSLKKREDFSGLMEVSEKDKDQNRHAAELVVLNKMLSYAASTEGQEFKLVDIHTGKEPHLLEAHEINNGFAYDETNVPVVWMHGMGDSGENPGMQQICDDVRKAHNTYVLCLDVANGMMSIVIPADRQMKGIERAITGDKVLQKAGYIHALGNSQGGLLMRAYLERVNKPQVRRFISWTGVQNGVDTCPLALTPACLVWGKMIDPYKTFLIFSDYWKDHSDQATYLKENRFMADINNERAEKNASYKANMLKLEKYVLTEALEDTMVYPHKSESHGYWTWVDPSKKGPFHRKVEKMEDSDAYKGDWLGLKTLNEAGKLKQYTFNGNHMAVPADMWQNDLLPLLGSKLADIPSQEQQTVFV